MFSFGVGFCCFFLHSNFFLLLSRVHADDDRPCIPCKQQKSSYNFAYMHIVQWRMPSHVLSVIKYTDDGVFRIGLNLHYRMVSCFIVAGSTCNRTNATQHNTSQPFGWISSRLTQSAPDDQPHIRDSLLILFVLFWTSVCAHALPVTVHGARTIDITIASAHSVVWFQRDRSQVIYTAFRIDFQ